jgi:DNA-binding response OmpR family regulator
VDDDEGARDTIAAYLNKMLGFKVVTAATGEAGLREAARVKPQTILLDYQLPDIDGIKCLRALSRQDWRSRRPVVILFTADWSIEDHANEIHALGATIP